ncbi:hypothetical protein G5I_03366 [Acromyrmex echinatior]|uniref:Uncharacterized protein n=1 Tax=Acromyrmex echinatior TaxID=103372 RepID=F4WCT6_ACREC|nr:hypothetical protein G5I_03366 [Acromyrmex echinatior]
MRKKRGRRPKSSNAVGSHGREQNGIRKRRKLIECPLDDSLSLRLKRGDYSALFEDVTKGSKLSGYLTQLTLHNGRRPLRRVIFVDILLVWRVAADFVRELVEEFEREIVKLRKELADIKNDRNALLEEIRSL